MNHKKSIVGKSRDLNIGNAGKGDKSRVTNHSAYTQNFSEINWDPKPVDGFAGFQKLPFDDSESWDR